MSWEGSEMSKGHIASEVLWICPERFASLGELEDINPFGRVQDSGRTLGTSFRD